MSGERYYRDRQAWRELEAILPERLRLASGDEPEEEFWDWHGHSVHLDRYRSRLSRVRVLLHHGIGTNGRHLSLLLGAPLARLGYDVTSLDNLGFGMTRVRPGSRYTYDDWVRMVIDLVAAERVRDPRPIVMFGHSAGGMLGYHVAAASPKGTLAGIGGTAFLDLRVGTVRRSLARTRLAPRTIAPTLRLIERTRVGDVRFPIMWIASKSALANDLVAMQALRDDPASAGSALPLRFFGSYLTYAPAVEPALFDACPVLHAQPAADTWASREVSLPVVSAIARVPVVETSLDGAGHVPVTDPALQQLTDAVHEFARRVTTPSVR